MLRRLGRGCAAVGGLFCSAAHAEAPAPAQIGSPTADSPFDAYRPPFDPAELLRLDDTMGHFFAARVPAGASDVDRLRAILAAILQPDGLNFSYDAAGTFDARETFRRRRGNCASFSFLVVAAARSFGLDARFQSLERTTRWTRVGDIVAAVLHVNVRVTTSEGDYVVDLDPDLVPPRAMGEMTVVGDERACALFYCNVGFGHVVQGRIDEALQTMALATRVDPTCASAWTNRATLQARSGDLRAAKASFERSLRMDPRGEAALDGFIGVLRLLGTPEDLRKADRLERKAQAIRARNPYYLLRLAERALDEGNPVAAERLLRRAISLQDDEPAFYERWIAVLEQLGRERDARRAGDKLAKLRARLAATSVHIVP